MLTDGAGLDYAATTQLLDLMNSVLRGLILGVLRLIIGVGALAAWTACSALRARINLQGLIVCCT